MIKSIRLNNKWVGIVITAPVPFFVQLGSVIPGNRAVLGIGHNYILELCIAYSVTNIFVQV
jgi:hypothetical protein